MFTVPQALQAIMANELPKPDQLAAIQPLPSPVVVRVVDHLDVSKPISAQLAALGADAPRWAALVPEENEGAPEPSKNDPEELAAKEARATQFAKPFGKYVIQDVTGTLAHLIYVRTPPPTKRPVPGAIGVLHNCEMRRGVVIVGERGRLEVYLQPEPLTKDQQKKRLELEKTKNKPV